MADIDSLNYARAQRAKDNRLLTPLEILRQVVADVEAGRSMPGGAPNQAFIILLRDDTEDYEHATYRANISSSQSIAILEIVKSELARRFSEPD